MLAQILRFDGPRPPEILAAADRAGRDRLAPIILAHPKMRQEMVALVVLRQHDGSEENIMIVRTAAGLQLAKDLVMTSEILPVEDPALLAGPDRVDVFTVVKVVRILDHIAGLDGDQS
jgi:hypothetical protein